MPRDRNGSSPSVLHLLVSAGETSAPLNEHVLGSRGGRVGLCSFHPCRVALPATVRSWHGGGSARGFLRALTQALDEGAWDVVHAHSPHVAVLFLLLRVFGRRSGVPPVVLTVHSSHAATSRRNRALLLPAFLGCDVVVFCGHASYASFPSLARALAGTRAQVIPNGVDVERVDRVADMPRRSPRPRVAFVGRLIALKDPLTVVRAFAALDAPGAELVVVGQGALAARLRREARALGVADRVHLRGLVPREEVYRELGAATAFVSTSRAEGLPVAVLEAMACRCPVVLSDIGPHRELLPDGVGVPLVASGDVAGLAHALSGVLAMSEAEREHVGDALRRHVEQEFGLDRMRGRYAEVYARLAGPGGTP